jgi:2-amino-4-hydroxy-6-hydroxymethyldihydropteridine diphosphokinase
VAIHYVALGANLAGPDGASPRQMCERAIAAIANLPGLSVQVRSRWFSSAAVPLGPQPRYVNGMVRICGTVSPAELLAELQELERRAGRVRGAPNAARPLDLDIIDMAGLVRDAPHPVLPHPRAHERAFVLLPLRDVAPSWVHPRLATPIAALIAALTPQDIHAEESKARGSAPGPSWGIEAPDPII